MALRNLMETIVADIVDEIISNNNKLSLDHAKREDIIAYVLNRVPARYITGERGILHSMLEDRYAPQKRSDVLFLVYEAFDIITKRRDTGAFHSEEPPSVSRFPHVMGEVLEETTFSVIPDVTVTLEINNKAADMVDAEWENPYKTHKATKGYYHFWPAFSEAVMGNSKVQKAVVRFSHPQFAEKSIELDLEVLDAKDTGKTKVVPIVLLKAKEGVDLAFLYDE